MKNIFKPIFTFAVTTVAISSPVLIQVPKARSVSLTIQNPVFESPVVPFNFISSQTNPNTNPPITGWQLYDPNGLLAQAVNYTQASVGVEANPGAYNVPISGNQYGYIAIPANQVGPGKGVAGISQTLTDTLKANTNYVLKMSIGSPQSYSAHGLTFSHIGFPGYRVDLLAGVNVIATDNNILSIPNGYFGTSVVSYTALANDPNLGKPLQIRITNLNSGPGGDVDIDDVSLTATAIPEPTFTLGLLAVGTFGAVSAIRKKPSGKS